MGRMDGWYARCFEIGKGMFFLPLSIARGARNVYEV